MIIEIHVCRKSLQPKLANVYVGYTPAQSTYLPGLPGPHEGVRGTGGESVGGSIVYRIKDMGRLQ